jgi:metal-responsive CopG/Arc/MetJ family transcriptional regulator
MKRILVDLSNMQFEALARLGEIERRPRAAIIRDAIDAYISERKARVGSDVFGLWKSRNTYGLEYQRELRSE